jgi:hypothetical protein
MPGEDVAKQRHVAVDVLGWPEGQREDLGGGVIHGAEQRAAGSAVLQPGEGTAVDLDHRAPGLFRGAAPPRARRPAPPLGRQAKLAPHASDRLAADG